MSYIKESKCSNKDRDIIKKIKKKLKREKISKNNLIK